MTVTVSVDTLNLSVSKNDIAIIEPSPVGLLVDGVNYGIGVSIGSDSSWSENTAYPWRGVKSTAVNDYNAKRISITRNSETFYLDVKAFDDGAAYRMIIPRVSTDTSFIESELTQWVIPSGSAIWYQQDTLCNEGFYQKAIIDTLKSGFLMGPPATISLSDSATYASITEAGEFTYSGMFLITKGNRALGVKYHNDTNGFNAVGEIRSSWRVVMAGTLNELVNCDIIHNVCDAPDPVLFPNGFNENWITPGRTLWQWWAYDQEGMQWNLQKKMVDSAAMLNCAYYLVDEGWEDTASGWCTSDSIDEKWDRLKELCTYAAEKGVKILVWRYWMTDLLNPWETALTPFRYGIETHEKRVEFFQRLVDCGVAGAKIDFMNSESAERLSFYDSTRRDAQAYKLMIDFHGANKPRGESRTWPNEITREGIGGLEYLRWETIPLSHYAALPFTRFLAGAADFTPATLSTNRLRGTTVALQLATAVVYTSPLLVWADKAGLYLKSPAASVFNSLPTVWDETRVLAGSKIGELCVMARRSGSKWYVGIINGVASQQTYSLNLSFLGSGDYNAVCFKDSLTTASLMVSSTQTVTSSTVVPVTMRSGGGWVGCFTSNSAVNFSYVKSQEQLKPVVHLLSRKHVVTVRLNGNNNNLAVQVIDLKGKIIAKNSTGTASALINLGQAGKGVYILDICSGKQHWKQKVSLW